MLLDSVHAASELSDDWLAQTSLFLLQRIADGEIAGNPAVISSFGAESAVLLHLVARVDQTIPVFFIDTRMMFEETLEYQRDLSAFLGLRDVRIVRTSSDELELKDPDATLHRRDADACCQLRKVVPLNRALSGFDIQINGRKRHQTSQRAAIKPLENGGDGVIRVNPLLHWMASDLKAYFDRHDLPRHPLVKDGLTSIGCVPCTQKPINPDDPRSGRWAETTKTECGIHHL